MNKNTVCLWFDQEAEDAARFYTNVFPDSHIHSINRAPTDYPGGKAGMYLPCRLPWPVFPASA